MIGDSHIKGCANTLQSKLKDQYEVTGYVKPGAEIQTLTSYIYFAGTVDYNAYYMFSIIYFKTLSHTQFREGAYYMSNKTVRTSVYY